MLLSKAQRIAQTKNPFFNWYQLVILGQLNANGSQLSGNNGVNGLRVL